MGAAMEIGCCDACCGCSNATTRCETRGRGHIADRGLHVRFSARRSTFVCAFYGWTCMPICRQCPPVLAVVLHGALSQVHRNGPKSTWWGAAANIVLYFCPRGRRMPVDYCDALGVGYNAGARAAVSGACGSGLRILGQHHSWCSAAIFRRGGGVGTAKRHHRCRLSVQNHYP